MVDSGPDYDPTVMYDGTYRSIEGDELDLLETMEPPTCAICGSLVYSQPSRFTKPENMRCESPECREAKAVGGEELITV